MNKERRARLAALKDKLETMASDMGQLLAEAEEVRDEEQEAFDNLPESLQQGEREEQNDTCSEVPESILEAVDTLQTTIQTIEGLL